jgi:hypothetical protein
MSLKRKTGGGLLLLGGAVVFAASPLGTQLRLSMRTRLAAVAYRHDPVAPFCAAPCYAPAAPEGADNLTGHTEALP